MNGTNWKRIIGVTGTSFFTTLIGVLTFDRLTTQTIPLKIMIPAAICVAGINGALSFFKEITEDSENKNPRSFRNKGTVSLKIYTNKILKYMVML